MTYFPEPKLLGVVRAEDFPKDASVTVSLVDGSVCRFRNAFYHREDDWFVVYSERGGYHAFRLATILTIKGNVRVS